MKRTFRIFHRSASKMHFGTLFVICFLAAGPLSSGAPLRSAHVSQVIRDVRLLPTNAAPRPAAVNDNIVEGTAVRTGTESRAELTFADLTITRLGENTVFSFNEAARELNVTKGAILLAVPSKAPAAKINTPAVTASVMGGTALFATGPPVKCMDLEGIVTFYPAGHPEQAVTLHGGEMVMMSAEGRITQPARFSVPVVLETSPLIVDFPALANLPLILQVVNQQLAEESAGTPNPPPSKNPLDLIDVLTQNVTANPIVATFTATPTGTPSEFGPPSTITSPNPYVITSGTTITTDPTITTNGVIEYGKIYRGQSIDGPLSAYLFGSTSAFDSASGFDTVVGGGGGNGIGGKGTGAAFKFTSVELAGDPTLITTNGQINLGLVGVEGITSGAPGGTLTFAGIRGLLLGTQDGPITLGPEISFSGLHDINIYARGSRSDLTLGSDISTSRRVFLLAERDMSMTSNITTAVLLAEAGRNVTLNDSAIIHAETITLSAGQDLNVSGTANVTNDATFNVLGSNGVAEGAAINFKGGSYGVGGTFLSTIDGDGAITFNNAIIGADVVKVGVFGTNGTLTIGGGAISPNTLLKLYAPGSNGTLNFVANVTLSSGTAANLAANTITIQPSVVVNIAGNGGPANIFTKNPNYNFTPGSGYTGPPGNPSNGSFGGPNGALDPQPLANAPPFGDPPSSSSSGAANAGAQTLSSAKVTSSGKISGGLGRAWQKSSELAGPNRKGTGATMNIANSAQLLSLLDAAVPGPGGKITISTPNRINRSKNSNRSNVDGRLKVNGDTAGVRHARDSADNPRLLASARSFAP